MYQIKSNPEDFLVEEIPDYTLSDSGQYIICLMEKTNYTTIRALEQLAKSLNIRLKDIGFAGTKDKNAITRQYISIRNSRKEAIENISLKDIHLQFIGYSKEPLSLGNLKGNRFTITIRDLKLASQKDFISK